jgi:hypothetical protein
MADVERRKLREEELPFRTNVSFNEVGSGLLTAYLTRVPLPPSGCRDCTNAQRGLNLRPFRGGGTEETIWPLRRRHLSRGAWRQLR